MRQYQRVRLNININVFLTNNNNVPSPNDRCNIALYVNDTIINSLLTLCIHIYIYKLRITDAANHVRSSEFLFSSLRDGENDG